MKNKFAVTQAFLKTEIENSFTKNKVKQTKLPTCDTYYTNLFDLFIEIIQV